MTASPRTGIFISYSHKDEEWLHRLRKMLRPVEDRHQISTWSDKDIKPGDRWRDEIEKSLAAAKVAVLIVSPDFLASEFIKEYELPRLFEKAGKKELPILWVAARYSMFQETGIGDLQALNDPTEPLESLSPAEQERVLVQICQGIKSAAQSADGPRSKAPKWRARRGVRAAGETISGRGGAPLCPYRGLFAFREEDGEFFFGRDTFAERLVKETRKKNFIALIGSSGVGKSSVILSGLVPRLRQRTDWLILTFRPGDRPCRALAAALIPYLEDQKSESERLIEVARLAKLLTAGEVELRDIAERVIEKNHGAGRLLLIIDQFEEVYTHCEDSDERKQFLNSLLRAAKAASPQTAPPLSLLIAMRADFLGYALSDRAFADALQNADLKLGPMSREEMRDAIEKPAHKLRVRIQDGLTERIMEAVSEEPGSLPLLEFALTQLWAQQSGGELTHQAYDEIGGVRNALATYAEEIFSRLDDGSQKQAQSIFVQLVRPGEGTEDTRRLASRLEIGEDKWAMVAHLANARLVVSGRNDETGLETAEVVHEALIQGWPRLRQWMAIDREFRTWQERLRASIIQWKSNDRDRALLLQGALLERARWWKGQRPSDINAAEQEYIAASEDYDREKLDERQKVARLHEQVEELKMQVVQGPASALALTGLAASVWRHSVNGAAINIKNLLTLMRMDASGWGLEAAHAVRLNERLAFIERLVEKILRDEGLPTFNPEMVVERVSLGDFLRELVSRLARNRFYGGVEFVLDLTDGGALVTLQPDWFSRAIEMLIDNAVEAMSGSALRRVTMVTSVADDRLVLTISDTGGGMLPEMADSVFKKAATGGRMGKFAVGLLMTRMILETYRGDIRVKETGPEGTTFVITLPLER